MGKQGPCYHCGVTSTPLWRNGPPDKPVLCNACGSRWRTKGTLANYTPLHARAEADEYEDQRVSNVKSVSLKIGDVKLNKRKLSYENSTGKRFASNYYKQGFLKTTDEDTSYRSSSGSALSNSESFAQTSSADTSDLTDPPQSPVWETQVPSKKRTSMACAKPSPVEKFINDLHAILQEQQSSCLSGSSEEDLLIESDAPMVSVEIGHGSVLIKHPSWVVREEDSEASSLSFDNKPCVANEAYSHSVSLCGSNGFKGSNIAKFTGKTMQQEPPKRDKFNHDRMQQFVIHNSPLCHIDLNDVINFEALLGHFTSEEQQQLLTYLPSDDTSKLPGSLKTMFDSSCFKENLSHFQQLLSDGVFSNSYSGAKAEDFKALKKLAVSNFTKSNWMESYSKLKDSRSSNFTQEIEVESGSKLGLSKYLLSAKRPLQEQNLNMPGKETTEGPKRGLTRFGLGSKEPLERGGSFFTPGSLFRLSSDGHCISLESCQDECSDQDLLLDVPSNGAFPEAELLFPPSSMTSRQTSVSSSSMHQAKIHH